MSTNNHANGLHAIEGTQARINDLQQIRKQAKDLLKDFQSHIPGAIERFHASHLELTSLTSASIDSLPLCLADAQLVIAREHGYPSWAKLKGASLQYSREPTFLPQSIDEAMSIITCQLASYQTADRSILRSSLTYIDSQIENYIDLTIEIVRQLYKAAYWVDDKPFTIHLMKRYLKEPLSPDEEQWARFELANNLASSGKYAESVAKQKENYLWAKKNRPVDSLLYFINISTQALCWIEMKCGNEWMEIFNEVMALVRPSDSNRMDRFILLRTAAVMQKNIDRQYEKAFEILNRSYSVADEYPDWTFRYSIQIRAIAYEMTLSWEVGDTERGLRAGNTAAALLKEYEAVATDRADLGTGYNNIAAAYQRLGNHIEAIRMFQRAHELQVNQYVNLVGLAESVWAATSDRNRTIELLHQAIQLAPGGSYNLGKDSCLANDPEFVKIACGYR